MDAQVIETYQQEGYFFYGSQGFTEAVAIDLASFIRSHGKDSTGMPVKVNEAISVTFSRDVINKLILLQQAITDAMDELRYGGEPDEQDLSFGALYEEVTS